MKITNKGETTEEWRSVVGYEGLYEVSNLGMVKSVGYSKGSPRMLKPLRLYAGYLQVALCLAGVRKNHLVHRLVMAAFVGPCPGGVEVNHVDHDQSNNRLENLEYVTHRENVQHSMKAGRRAVGQRVNTARLTEDQAKAILARTNKTPHSAIAAEFGVTRCTISALLRGDTWKHLQGAVQ